MTLDIEGYLKRQLEDIDLTSHVRAVVKELLTEDIKTILKNEVAAKASEFVEAEVTTLLEEGIEINDGWGKQKFKSYTDFFRDYFKEKIKGYDIKRTITNTVKKRVDELFTAELKTVINKIADELILSVKEKE